jgi:hypothetical protein
MMVNEFYRRNSDALILNHRNYGIFRPVEQGGVLFCHAITALVDVEPIVDEPPTPEERELPADDTDGT